MTKVTAGFCSFTNAPNERILPLLTSGPYLLFEVCLKLFFHFSPDLSNGHFPKGLPTAGIYLTCEKPSYYISLVTTPQYTILTEFNTADLPAPTILNGLHVPQSTSLCML
jgi:hypothetical protein